MGSQKSVILKGQEYAIRKEAKANGPITPGHLLDYVHSGSGLGNIQIHSVAGDNAANRFAVEQDFFGKGIDDAYATSDQVQYAVLTSGSEVNAFLAIGENVNIGDTLESNGDGSLRAHSPQQADSNGVMVFGEVIKPERIVGYALEAIDNRGSSNQSRIIVELA